jgi:hypothetical protein
MSKNNIAWSIAISLVAAQSWLSAVAGEEQSTTASPVTDPYLQCIWKLAADPQYSDIAAKLPLKDMTTISFSMLADETRPTPTERKEISDWFDRRDECLKAGEALHRAQWPPELFQLGNEGSAGVKAIGVDLYNRKITYGEANKQIQQLGDNIKAKAITIIKQYQADIAAQKAASEQQAQQRQEAANRQAAQEQADANAQYAQQQMLKQQRIQIFLNYMQAQQQAQQQQLRDQFAPRPTYNTNCITAGSSTNCTTH